MADVSGKFFSAKKVRTGVSPSSPGVIVGETLPPVNPPGGGLNSVGLTMPAAFDVANSPLTSNGTIEVTGAGTTAEYVRGDGSLATFPALTGFVPYTGATADVDLGTHDLTAERGTFENNGSSDTLTVNHTSGSGKGINVSKGGNGEALLVTKTSGSGNAMAVVGGRTSLVDLSLSSVSNATGNFLTISGGVVHQRTPSETRSDVGAQAQLNGTGFVKASGTTITYDNSTYQVTSEKAQPNGYASLDSNGKVPLVQINDALIGNVNFQGLWNASTNTPTLANPPASGTKGYYYIVSTAGSFAGIDFEVGDWIISNGTAWGKVDNTDAVSSVFGRTGNVTATNGDYNTSQVTENTNLYYTEARVNANTNVAANTAARHNAVTLGTANGLSLSTQVLSLQLATSGQNGALSSTDWTTFNNKENAITAGTTAQYFRGDKTFQTLNTGVVPESGNLYFTNARAIASVLTGYTSGAGTISAADSILSAIQKLNGNIGSLVTGVSSVNGQTGVVVLTTTNIAEGTNLYYTEARVNANTNVAANTAARHAAVTLGTANGLSLSTQQLSLGLASAGVTGALSGTDWSTFNSKQNALTNPVTGTGTTNYLPKFTGASTIGNSLIFDNGSNVGINTTTSTASSGYTTLSLNGSTGGQLEFQTAGFGKAFIYSNSTDLRFYTFGGTFRFENTTGVEIGYSSSQGLYKLDVNGTGRFIGGTSNIPLQITSSSSNGTILGLINTNAGTNSWGINSYTNGVLYFQYGTLGSGSNLFYVTSLGAATFSSSVTATNFIRSGGTSSQFLKADGSVDSNSYYLASNPSAFIALTALSGTAPIQYNNTTGAISITQSSGSTNGFLSSTDWNTFNNKTSNVGTVTSVAALTLGTTGTDLSSSVANGTTTPVITLNVPTASAANRGALSAADWTTFNGKENAITAGTTAQYYRGDKTFQTLNTAAVPELTNLYYTEARVSANTDVAANTAARHAAVTLGTTNGLSLSTQQLSLGLASSSANGALSSTDWSTFNSKQNALTNPVTGTGTTNYLPKFTGTSTIGNSIVEETGNGIEIASTNYRGVTLKTSTTSVRPTLTFLNTGANNSSYIQGVGRDIAFGNLNSDYGGHTETMLLNSSGNLGLGVTPSAWGNTSKPLQAADASFWGLSALDGYASVGGNYFYNGNYVYIKTGQATDYYQYQGVHAWRTAPSGTAGNAISFTQAMTLGSNSGLSIGTPSAAPSQGLLVQGEGRFLSDLSLDTTVANTQRGLIFRDAGTVRWQVYKSTVNDFRIYRQGSSNDAFIIGTNDAATFSSSVTALRYIANAQATYGSLTYEETFKYASSPAGIWFGNSFNSNNNVGVQLRTSNDNTSVQALTITPQGNVGIGTTTPASSAGFTTLSINGSTGGQIEFKTGDAGKAYIYSNSTDLRFYTGGGTFRFENTTGLEVGYSASQGLYKLDVNGKGRFSSGSSDNPLLLTTTSSNGTILGLISTSGGTQSWGINSYTNGVLYFQSGTIGAGTNAVYFTSAGAATFSSSVTASSFIRSGGTSSQYLMADGSVSTLTNPVTGTGSGTTNTIPKFTGANALGNSIITDSGSLVSIDGNFRIRNSNGFNDSVNFDRTAINGLILNSSGNLILNGSTGSSRITCYGDGYFSGGIQTGNPYGTTAANWLLGRFLTETTSANGSIRVQIGSKYYNIAAEDLGTVPT